MLLLLCTNVIQMMVSEREEQLETERSSKTKVGRCHK